jgi:membrane glycosyltransferase
MSEAQRITPRPPAGAGGGLQPHGDLLLDRLLQDWRGAVARASRYLAALGFPEDVRRRRSRDAALRALESAPGASALSDTLDAAEDVLLESWPLPASPEASRSEAFARWRHAVWRAGAPPQPEQATLQSPEPLHATPPLLRGAMVPERYRGRRLGEWGRRGVRADEKDPAAGRATPRWRRRGRIRRLLLLVLVIAPSVVAGASLLEVLPGHGNQPLELLLSFFFGALFGWLSVGFWTALFGFGVLVRRGDRFSITRGDDAADVAVDPAVRTAIVMPICDEPVDRVFAGLRAVRASLERSGHTAGFDFFVLSDTAVPSTWVEEEQAFWEWRRQAAGPGGIYYRRRKVRRKRKSGNVADFCRRFGRHYRYMVVLDADSVMNGESLQRLVRLMERNPEVGIIQTAPRVVRARTLFARIQQFAARLYGPIFAAGMHYWQLGDSPFWGHNAILRVEPFMKHCGLPRLSGTPPLGGDILSHDFVEAALLGRAGFSVWLAFDIEGSWEEAPSTLLEEMRRDQRWCQGNLQHLRLIFTEGVYATHRALFLNGIFSYVSALLWLGFLAASTAEAILWSLRGPDYFPTGRSLFPTWPVWRPEWAISLAGAVGVVLFLPKLLAVALAVGRGQSKGFGGLPALLVSVLLETLATALMAPIRMVFYCRFVMRNLFGRSVGWRGGEDEEDPTPWSRALRRHGPDALIASVWAVTVYWLHPEAFFWLTPVAAALVLSVPLSVWTSRRSLGERARAARIFLTPEERTRPREIRELEAEMARSASAARADGFVRAIVDPLVNALHTALLRGTRSRTQRIRAARRALCERALRGGPQALARLEQRVVLSDADCLRDLHRAVWRLEGAEAARWEL